MQNKCSVNDCWRETHGLGFCRLHYGRFRRNGTPERIKVENKGKTCRVDGCDEWAKKSGYCPNHYQRLFKYKRLDEHKNKRTHPYYILWHTRKQSNVLCERWLDFWAFAGDIGERPNKNHSLVQLRHGEPFGPDNFEWKPYLRRRNGESKKEWHARKWQSRNANHPGWQTAREYKRKYGITVEEYDMMHKAQNGLCAICNNPETQTEHKSGAVLRLAVDHCHTTKKIRGLLCRRCNTFLGAIEENLTLVRAIESYIQRHNNGRLL